MADLACELLVTEAQLEAPPLDADNTTGAAADFWGIVRGSEDGREIDGIDYEAHQPMAEHQLKKIGVEAIHKFGLSRVLIHHRIGFIAVGEPSLFVRVYSPHRQEGFHAIRWIVDELKTKAPIWKKPRFQCENSVAGVVDAGPGSPVPATTNADTV
jgi:molybdopterin synthase catalytic subunit